MSLIERKVEGPLTNFRKEMRGVATSFNLEALSRNGVPELVTDALRKSGQSEAYICPLSRRLVFWIVLCLPLFRSESITEIGRRLASSLRGRFGEIPLDAIGDDAIAHGRKRVGVEPLRHFFRDLGKVSSVGPLFHGKRLLAIDGERLSMPDTPQNAAFFGKSRNQRAEGIFPQALVVALMAVRTRELIDADIAATSFSEHASARLLARSLGPNDLVLIDRGFCCVEDLQSIQARGAATLCRAPSYIRLTPLPGQEQGRLSGDWLAQTTARVPLAPGEAASNPRAKTKKVTLVVRVIEYLTLNNERVRLIFSMLNQDITCAEIIALYHERWEIELANDETKTHLSPAPSGTHPTVLRSKTPANVCQEIYALLSVYTLIRQTMTTAANARLTKVDTLGLSFTGSMQIIRRAVHDMSSAPARRLPLIFAAMLRDISAAKIDRPRRKRRYSRVVKRPTRSSFPKKRPQDGALPAFTPKPLESGSPRNQPSP